MRKSLQFGVATAAFCLSTAAWALVTPCTTDQMTFGIAPDPAENSDACLGWDDSIDANPTAEAAYVNGGWDALFGGGTFEYVRKYNDGTGEEGPGTFGGINFSLTATAGAMGEYTLSWDDGGSGILPETLDIAFVAKSAQGSGAFLFDDVTLTVDPLMGGGTFEIGVTNRKGVPQAISHLTMFLRGGGDGGDDGFDGTTETPAPAPLLLVGLGVLLLVRRGRATR